MVGKEVKKKGKMLKTFNLDSEIYDAFSEHCKDEGISMSRRVNNFIKQELGKLGKLKLDLEKGDEKRKAGGDDGGEHPLRRYC